MARNKHVKGYRATAKNQERAEAARLAVETMRDEADLESSIADLIANLMHLATQEGLDPYAIHQRALTTYFEPEIDGKE